MTRQTNRRPRRSGDPYGILPPGASLAPILSAIGLAVAAIVTLALFTGNISTPVRGSDNNSNATAAPSNIVVANPQVSVKGSLVYAKAGNIWVQSGTDTHQVTSSGHDSMPSWSPDGQWIYYVETRSGRGFWPASGSRPVYYDMTYPVVSRVHPDGSGRQELISGLYHAGAGNQLTWFRWYRQPVVSPDGGRLALVSDAPDPTRRDVVLQFYDLTTKQLTTAPVGENAPLGHQDPKWRPDGKAVAFVMNGHDGSRGTPVIYVYDLTTKHARAVSGPGFMNPSWSPDGRFIAATKTSPLGTDVVILDASTGNPVLQLTNDDRSWNPTWSPAGNELVYMHLHGQIVDIRMVRLGGSAPNWSLSQQPDVTENSGIDGASQADWYIPASELPTPAPSTLAPSPSTSRPAGASTSP